MRLPPGPKTPPSWQLFQWVTQPLDFLEVNAKRYGDIFTAQWQGFPPFILLHSPQGIQELLTADPHLVDGGTGNQILAPVVGQHSLALLDGEPHMRQRRLLMPPFHGERLRTYGEVIGQVATEVLEKARLSQPFPVRVVMQEITLRVILQTVFGLDAGERYEQLRQLLSEMLDTISSRWSSALLFLPVLQKDWGAWSPWGKYIRRQHQIDQLIFAEIAQRRQSYDPNRTDVLNLLLGAVDEAGEPMSDQELRDELMTILVAGHETTASALAWAFYWVAHRPDVHEKLLKDLDSLDASADPMQIARLPYLTAVCQETLRIYPVAMLTFVRRLKAPLEVMGYQFAEHQVLIPCIYLLHHRPDLYPQPQEFRPERFLERQFSPYEYLPFGGSNRRCLGMAFAMLEMKLVLATLVRQFELTLATAGPVQPVRRGLTLAPSANLCMIARERDRIPVMA